MIESSQFSRVVIDAKCLILRILLVVLCQLFFLIVNGQSESEIEDLLANQILEESESSADISDYSESLSDLIKRPLDLNTATEAEFRQLLFLSNFQIQQILLHRQKIGSFQSPLELQVVPGISLELLDQLLLFVQVRTKDLAMDENLEGLLKKSQGSWMTSYGIGLEKSRGYLIDDPERSRYLGSADKLSSRFRWSYKDRLKFSINMEKDAGEPFFKEKQQQGFDHYSGSFLVQKVGVLEKLIVGDYLLQFGQGLALWNGPVFGKGASVAHIMQNGAGIRPHTGMMESNFMRGLATTVKLKSFSFTPFYSSNYLTASIRSGDEGTEVTSINYSGLHRTPSELRNRKSLKQSVYGANVSFNSLRFQGGVNYLSTHFDIPLRLNTRPYSQFRFEGEQLQQVSAFYQYSLYNVLAFGETAHAIGAGWANNHGIIAALGRKFSASASYRNYKKDYHSFFAQSFQDQSNLANEQGWHVGLV